jgi:pimeloyl-ACP methyl ester carboxylesterase
MTTTSTTLEDVPHSAAGVAASLPGRPAPWILLRGLLRDRRHWGSLPGRLAAFAPGQVVEAYDLPGNGSRHRERSASDVASMVVQLREDLRRRGVPTPVRLLGMSLGGLVAIEWARQHPQEVEQIVLVNTAVAPTASIGERMRPSLWLPFLRLLLLPASAQRWENTLLPRTSRRYRRQGSPARQALLQRWSEWRRNQPVSRGNVWRQLWAGARYRAPVAPDAPGLMLVSTRDDMVDPASVRRVAEAWGWPVVEHPKAGHDLALDDPR